jgi:N6-adenosine-specific RNA methylase IME4
MTDRWTTCLMDPPWPEHGGGKIKRGADRHYPLVKVRDMLSTISMSGVWHPADDAHLYMWVTDNYLSAGLRLIGDLGFRFVRTWVWVKLKQGVDPGLIADETLLDSLATGIGQYARGSHELLLFGVRGEGMSVRSERRDIGSVIPAVRGKHSAKPQCVHELVEARSRGPYLEMFARSNRDGWSTWGNDSALVINEGA